MDNTKVCPVIRTLREPPFLLDGIPPVVRGALANTCRYPRVLLHRLDSSGLYTRYENALPGLEKWIVDDSGDSEIEELQQASSEVASSCDKSADSNGNCKRLQDHGYMYQADREHDVVNRDNDDRYQHKRNHHEWVERHRDAKRHRFINIEYRRPQGHLSHSAQLGRMCPQHIDYQRPCRTRAAKMGENMEERFGHDAMSASRRISSQGTQPERERDSRHDVHTVDSDRPE